MKPLFIPLRAVYFDTFADGSKTTEYRKYGKRWNGRTCPPGRPVILSRGYGKQHRLHGYIESFGIHEQPWVMKDWRDIYGDDPMLSAACIKIRLSPTSREHHGD